MDHSTASLHQKNISFNTKNRFLCQFEDEIEQFGREVLPLIRQLEADGRGKNADFEIERTGDVYRKS